MVIVAGMGEPAILKVAIEVLAVVAVRVAQPRHEPNDSLAEYDYPSYHQSQDEKDEK